MSKFHCEKLAIPKMVKTFPAFYETQYHYAVGPQQPATYPISNHI
jgi:hypothetical protein